MYVFLNFLRMQKCRRIFAFLNMIVTIVSIVSANRIGLIVMLIWLVLFLNILKAFDYSFCVTCLSLPIIYIAISGIYIFQRFGIGTFSANVCMIFI